MKPYKFKKTKGEDAIRAAYSKARFISNDPKTTKGFDANLFSGDTGYYPHTSLRPTTTGGVGFGDEICDVDREYAALREPIGHFITAFVGADIFTNWFTINDLNTESPDEKLDEELQKALKQIGAQTAFTEGAIYERIYGSSYLVLALDDAPNEDSLSKEASESAEIVSISVYPRTKVTAVLTETDINKVDYGKVITYELDRGQRKTKVHASRVIKLNTRNGESVLDPVWDDMTCLRNIRWGMAQTIYRYGSGFPVITAKGATYKQLEEMADSERIKNLMSRTFFLKNEALEFEFKGAQSAALNPLPYYTPFIENISTGTKIPAAILRGVHAGALTGSEVNEREYAMLIRSIQKLFEEPLRTVIDRILNSLNKTIDYEIEWASVVHLSDLSVADLDLKNEQVNEKKLLYMTIDEVREANGLDPIGGEEGETIPGLSKPTQGGNPFESSGNPSTSSPSKSNPFLEELKETTAIEPEETTEDAHDARVRKPFEHPELVSDLKQILYKARRKEISKESALEQARGVIGHFVDDEIERARAYLSARLRRPMPILPIETVHQYDRMRANYMTDFNTILEDSLNKTRNKK